MCLVVANISAFLEARTGLSVLSGNDIEQIANTYQLYACNEVIIKASKPNLSN
jgi:hypothetical protein